MSGASKIRLRGVPLRVPTYEDEKTTQSIANQLDSMLCRIEENAERIDSLGFALRLAYDLAVELDAHKRSADEDLKALLRQIDRIKTRLEHLSERLDNPPEAPEAPQDTDL